MGPCLAAVVWRTALMMTAVLGGSGVAAAAGEEKHDGKKLLKLHLGCHTRDFGPEWVHIDSATHPHVSSHDIVDLPFANASVGLIYASHVFEYFDRDQAVDVLRRWRRVLAPGVGVLRLAAPDFEAIARLYLAHLDDPASSEPFPPTDLDTFVSMMFGKWDVGKGSTTASRTDETIYHRTVYDRKSLTRLLQASGFADVRPWRWQEIEHGHVDDYSQAYWPHMHKTNGTLVSLNLEATRPLDQNDDDTTECASPPPLS